MVLDTMRNTSALADLFFDILVQNSTRGGNESQRVPLYAYEADLIQRYSRGFCVALCLLGIWSNAINIRTFLRMKLEDTVTILFFYLAICDLGVSVTIFFENIGQIMDIVERDWNMQFTISPFILMVYTGSLKALFGVETTFLKIFLAIQRCICVVLPFHVKKLFTSFRTYLFIGITSTVMVIEISLYIAGWRVVKVFNPVTNTSYFILQTSQDITIGIFLMNTVLTTPFALVSQVLILACLVLMIVALKKSVRIRKSVTKDTTKDNSNSKERQALIQVTLVSTIFVITYIPPVVFGILNYTIPGLYLYGENHYLFYISAQIMVIGDIFNSAVNFFIYYKFNSKFKQHCFKRNDKI